MKTTKYIQSTKKYKGEKMNKNSIYYDDVRRIAISLARFALNTWNTHDYEILKVNGLLPSQQITTK